MSATLRIALIGAGHLGGSFALSLRDVGADVAITAFDSDVTQPIILQQAGAVDRIAADVSDAVRDADIVMLATPLRSYRALAHSMAPHLGAHTIVTDVGSVKCSMEALAGIVPAARLVPGHPIAGGERTGAAVARGDIFRSRLCILTPNDATDAQAVTTVETLWHLVGADVLRMPTAVHDTIYAYVSHLPHVIAFVAADALFHEGVRITADQEMLQRFLRISRSSPRMWTDIFLENRQALLPALGTMIALLAHFVRELSSGEKTTSDDHASTVAMRFLPRMLASSLISSVSLYEQQAAMSLRPFAAGGMRDIVAPAAIDPEQEMAAISQAAPMVAACLTRTITTLRALENLIGAEDADALFARIEGMVGHAHMLVGTCQ